MLKHLPFLLLVLLCSCQKDTTVSDSIIGEWQLVQTNFDRGDGTVIPSSISNGFTIEFQSNGRYRANTSTCQFHSYPDTPSEGRYDTDQQRLIPSDCQEFNVRYNWSNDTLWTYLPCREFCSYRFHRR